jgi:hypothetical protein
MPAKQILYSVDARSAIMRGVDQLAEAVKATLGPKGRNVVIDKKFGSPVSTKDGVTVAKEIELKDPFENMGAQMLREVASKTSDVAGDGTTTATVLAQAIFREGVKNVTAGGNPMDLKRGIDRAVEIVVEEVKKLSRPTKDKKEIAQVGTISANNDLTIGDLIAEAMEKVGKDGVITVEEAKSMDTSLDEWTPLWRRAHNTSGPSDGVGASITRRCETSDRLSARRRTPGRPGVSPRVAEGTGCSRTGPVPNGASARREPARRRSRPKARRQTHERPRPARDPDADREERRTAGLPASAGSVGCAEIPVS